MTETLEKTMTWTEICVSEKILSCTGVCALVDGKQVAVFRVEDRVFALSNFDPFTKANVLSRGIVGNRGDVLKVSSPLLKHSFNLETGEYLEDPSICLPTYAVKLEDGTVFVGIEKLEPVSI